MSILPTTCTFILCKLSYGFSKRTEIACDSMLSESRHPGRVKLNVTLLFHPSAYVPSASPTTGASIRVPTGLSVCIQPVHRVLLAGLLLFK